MTTDDATWESSQAWQKTFYYLNLKDKVPLKDVGDDRIPQKS